MRDTGKIVRYKKDDTDKPEYRHWYPPINTPGKIIDEEGSYYEVEWKKDGLLDRESSWVMKEDVEIIPTVNGWAINSTFGEFGECYSCGFNRLLETISKYNYCPMCGKMINNKKEKR